MYIKSQEGKKPSKKEDTPSWDDTESVEPTSGEALLRGAGQGISLGFLDELKAMLGTEGASPSQIVADPTGAAEKEREMFQQYERNLAEERELNKKSEETFPEAYMAGEIGAGVVPAIFSGGSAAAAKMLQEGGKQAAKQAAKSGAKYGGVAGVGYSEAETPAELATDAAIGTGAGAVTGAGLPILGKGVKESSKGLKTLGGKAVDLLPESDFIKAAYKYGKQGRTLNEQSVDEDLMKLGKKVLKNLDKKKKANNLNEVIEQLDELGYRVNAKGSVETAVDDLQKLSDGDMLGLQNKELLPKLQELLGSDKQMKKMVNKAEKSALKKAIESQSKQQQAIIKGEKALAKDQLKSGDSLETIGNVNKSMDDLELPLDTPEGRIGGVKGKFKGADGEEYTKSVLDDVTPYQPSISAKVGPDGRPIVSTTDAGTGKVSTLVGDIEKKVTQNLEEMTISEVEALRKQLNEATKLAAGQGSKNDPIVQRAMTLANELKVLTDDAVRAGGDKQLVDRRATFSDLFSGEELLGIDKKLAVRRDVDKVLKSKQLASKLGFNKGFDAREESKLAKQMLGDDVVTPEISDQFDLMKQLNKISGRESQENISRAGLYKKIVGDVPNLLGRGAKKISDVAEGVTSPVSRSIKKLTSMSDDEIEKVASTMAASNDTGAKHLGEKLLEALSQKGDVKSATLWSISQNPGFRSVLDKQVRALDNDMREDLGLSNTPSWDDTEEVEEEQVENTREPNAVKDIDEGLEHILNVEAGYQNQKEDTGNFLNGELIGTNRGITPAAYQAYYGKAPTVEDMQNLTKEQALEIYKNDYVKDPGFSQIQDPNLQTALVDYGVNSGPVRAIKAIQGIVGANPDGRLGPETLRLINEYDGDLRGELMNQRRDYLKNLNRPEYEKGWLNRVDHMEEITAPEEVEAVEDEIDRVNQQQSSGEMQPIDQLDSLLGMINNMNINQEDKDMLEDEAMAMESFSDGEMLKQMVREMTVKS